MKRLAFRLSSFGLLAALACGCGGNADGRVSVSGSVSYNGEPVESGSITFVPTDSKKPRAAGEILNGKYTIPADKGPMPGPHKVEILANKKTGKQVTVPGDTGNKTDQVKQILPAKYNTATTLTAEIKPSGNAVDFTNLAK